ncbi:MAG: hypothetical protein IPI40_19245 [Betaproteobacteria bacterium]|nr:hypothetical protein [Betaproteobacteria bacterium]
MAEIRNYTMNFGSGRPAALTCWRKSACTEIHRVPSVARGGARLFERVRHG